MAYAGGARSRPKPADATDCFRGATLWTLPSTTIGAYALLHSPGMVIGRVDPRPAPRLRRRTAFLDRVLQQLSELRCVPVTVTLHRVLHGHFDELLFTICGYCDRAFALRRHFPAIEISSCHDCLLWVLAAGNLARLAVARSLLRIPLQ